MIIILSLRSLDEVIKTEDVQVSEKCDWTSLEIAAHAKQKLQNVLLEAERLRATKQLVT